MDCISLSHVSKSYGKFIAVNNVTFSIPCNEKFALIGPNGAGKSTIMKIIAGLITPTHGAVLVKGHNPKSKEARKLIGYLPEDAVPYPYLTVRENLEYLAILRGVKDFKGATERMIEVFGLRDYEKKLASRLSRGNLQKLALALSVIHSPEILILDEPLNYLDIPTQEKVISFLNSLNVTMLVSTHIMAVALRLVNKVIVINHGKVVWQGTIEELRKLGEEDELIESIIVRVMDDS